MNYLNLPKSSTFEKVYQCCIIIARNGRQWLIASAVQHESNQRRLRQLFS